MLALSQDWIDEAAEIELGLSKIDDPIARAEAKVKADTLRRCAGKLNRVYLSGDDLDD